jgi:hypothetical protein
MRSETLGLPAARMRVAVGFRCIPSRHGRTRLIKSLGQRVGGATPVQWHSMADQAAKMSREAAMDELE